MWQIQMQEESVGRAKFPVKCKNVKFRPIEGSTGQIEGFSPLGFVLLQVIVSNGKDTLKLKLNASKGIDDPTFIVQHEDTIDYPLMTVGEGKKRRQIPDTLAEKVKVKGMQERYELPRLFSERISGFLGVSLATEVLDLFATKIAGIIARKKAS